MRSSRRRVGTQWEGVKCETQHGLLLFSAAGVREINILLYLSKQCDRPNIQEPDLIFVTNITNIIVEEKWSCGEISAFHVGQLWGN